MSTEIIAEIGWNFMGDMDLAAHMIAKAKDAGANTAKFQYWTPSRLLAGVWDVDGRRQIYEKAQLDPDRIGSLVNICRQNDIKFLISVFNVVDAKLMVQLGINEIKIPSHEVANFELHRFSAASFDRIYVSLGAGETSEIESAVEIYNTDKADTSWVGMHCVSSYPVPAEKANLQRLKFLSSMVPTLGYSDHTRDALAPSLAVALGAKVIEKHFTTDKNLPGRDNKNALDTQEFEEMVANVRLAERLLLDHGPGPMDLEADTIANYRGRWGGNE